jgi:uncharacterized protein (TIGR00369 family)
MVTTRRTFHLVAVDLPGFGHSQLGDELLHLSARLRDDCVLRVDPVPSQVDRLLAGAVPQPSVREEPTMTKLTAPSEHMALLDMQFDEVQPTRVSGSIAADERHHQPWGIVSGGQYTTAIEAFATFGAYEAVKDRGQQAVGVTNITDFVRPHKNGRLQVEAQAIHQGRTQQLWQVEIRRPDDDKLVARGQVRLQNIDA